MKEVTEWNGKPRYMWVWDTNEKCKKKNYVICILTESEMKECEALCPVKTITSSYSHCAEIEEEPKKETRLTCYELSQLLKCFGVESCTTTGDVTLACNELCYYKDESMERIKIRYKQGEWEEPTREAVWKWWGEEIPGSDIARFVSFIGWDKE